MRAFRYLLDTNIVSDLVRAPQGKIAWRIMRTGEARVCTSIIVACELRYGAARKGSAKLLAQLDHVLCSLPALPLEADADVHYGELRTALERKGEPIGQHDMLIAAHALSLDLILVTDNAKEFSRVPKLKTENWLRK